MPGKGGEIDFFHGDRMCGEDGAEATLCVLYRQTSGRRAWRMMGLLIDLILISEITEIMKSCSALIPLDGVERKVVDALGGAFAVTVSSEPVFFHAPFVGRVRVARLKKILP
ncbi:hypothetical protein CMV30_18525 [Nibricoccus aquaticus]|uniref:Uncharacterized protein n=2 Tax=Nibricoccus aquaticus TaxID=2576891 RepID=A0A290QNB5_9BACT|nr:hypothetical protein CMV30_18525 [Nibricoccus aquaticus]